MSCAGFKVNYVSIPLPTKRITKIPGYLLSISECSMVHQSIDLGWALYRLHHKLSKFDRSDS